MKRPSALEHACQCSVFTPVCVCVGGGGGVYLYGSSVVPIFGRCEAVTYPADLLAHLHVPPSPSERCHDLY